MPRKKKRRNLESLNGCKLRADKQRLTPGEVVTPTHVPETICRAPRHPDLKPLTMSGLVDAFKLNEIPFSYEYESAYECHVSARGLKVMINPLSDEECLQFFRDVICPR